VMMNLYHTIHRMQFNANDENNCTWILIRVHRNDLENNNDYYFYYEYWGVDLRMYEPEAEENN
jgi:hypothetical protein